MLLSYSVGLSRDGRAVAVGRRRDRAELARCEFATSSVRNNMNLLPIAMVAVGCYGWNGSSVGIGGMLTRRPMT